MMFTNFTNVRLNCRSFVMLIVNLTEIKWLNFFIVKKYKNWCPSVRVKGWWVKINFKWRCLVFCVQQASASELLLVHGFFRVLQRWSFMLQLSLWVSFDDADIFSAPWREDQRKLSMLGLKENSLVIALTFIFWKFSEKFLDKQKMFQLENRKLCVHTEPQFI